MDESAWVIKDSSKGVTTETFQEKSLILVNYPEKLIKPFILGTSKEGDTILDPFLGSGTTVKVSLDNGR